MQWNALPSATGIAALSRRLLGRADWARRVATLLGAIAIGLAAMVFAWGADRADAAFRGLTQTAPWLHLLLTPLAFLAIAWATRRFAAEARGSGIPQVIAASKKPRVSASRRMVSLRTALSKGVLTAGALAGGASVGREGPTVQLGAAIMLRIHRWFRVPAGAGIYIAGGAAGVAAAFNTPLAGIAFAIEELAVAYEQRVAVLVMGAVMIAGLTSQGLVGDYVYFGRLSGGLPVQTVLIAAPLAGIVGGAFGGLFSRLLLAMRGPGGRWAGLVARNPLTTALVCGVVVAVLGLVTTGATSGTGYEPTRALLEGKGGEYWFGPAKFVSTLATSVSGIPGGIFAPSLAVGAGFGQALTLFFPLKYAGLIVLVGMGGYFTGVVRAPLTAVIILSEATGNSSAIMPLFAACLLGDWAGALVCRERLYHALARGFAQPDP